ncbi:MAG: carboxypeptidase regulatory-like domain-containing protein [Gemmatimonadaceae bacterium]
MIESRCFSRALLLAGALVLTALVPNALGAQQRADSSALGVVRGVVYDSLLRAPLESATVLVQGATRIAVTDAKGRFVLDSVPAGRRFIAFSHPALDSIGLTTTGGLADITAGATTTIALATPSYATLRGSACTASLASADSGIVFGTIRDADSDVRMSGARAVISWYQAQRSARGTFEMVRPVVAARTDSTGTYYACGVATGVKVAMQGEAGLFVSGPLELVIGSRHIARRDVLVSRDSSQGTVVAAPADGATPEPPARRGSAVVQGIVRNGKGDALAGALVTMAGAPAEATTNETGRFALSQLPAGTQTLQVRLVGYAAEHVAADLHSRDTARVEVTMKPVNVLSTVTVKSKIPTGRDRAEFEQRRQMGFGYALTEDQIKSRFDVASLFYGFPGLRVDYPTGALFSLTMKSRSISAGDCHPFIYLDGIQTAEEEIQSYPLARIVGIEVYPSVTTAPAKYVRLGDCGVVLIWTKSAKW